MPVWPVSSATSRTAAVSPCSPSSSLPLGSDQSSYLGRWMTAVSTPPPSVGRQTAPPPARISGWAPSEVAGSFGAVTGAPHEHRLEVPLADAGPLGVAAQLPAPHAGRHGQVEDLVQLRL